MRPSPRCPAPRPSTGAALVTYARDLKARLAGVDEELIATEGVVNELTALQMALGAQARCDADWAVATTGVAGPTETDGASVGTVWFAVVGPGSACRRRPSTRSSSSSRETVSRSAAAAVEHAFAMLLRVL